MFEGFLQHLPQKMKNEFWRNYIFLSVLAGLFVAGIAFYSYFGTEQSGSQAERVDHTQSVLSEILIFRNSVHEMILEQRGYLLTGKENYLDRYNEHKEEGIKTLATLMRMTADNPIQNDKIQKLQTVFMELSVFLESRTSTVKPQNLEKAYRIDEASKHLETIAKSISSVLDLEERYFDVRLSRLMASNKRYYHTILFGSLAGVCILMLMNLYLLRAQNTKTKVEEALKDIQDKYTRALNATRDGIFEWDMQEGGGMYWSPRLKEMIGYGEDEIDACPNRHEELIHPEDRDVYKKALEASLVEGKGAYSANFRWSHKSGEWIWINCRGRVTFDENGKPVRLTGVCSDISELKAYEQKLEKSREEADKASRSKSEFLAHMSHEIRTPLTAITGVAEIMYSRRDDFDEKTEKLLTALNSSAISLRDLIDDILDFSKIESGTILLDEKPFKVAEIVAQVISIMSMRATEKKLRFVFDAHLLSDFVQLGDKARFRQILINIVGNAIKFTESGEVRITASFHEEDGKNFLQFIVRDTGIGIREEHLDAVFERFRQADSSISRKYGGTGLGLPISCQLARLMGVSINAESVYGEGATFTLRIPARPAKGEGISGDSEKMLALSSPCANSKESGPRILLAEDYQGNVIFISFILESMGIACDTAQTGLEALTKWNERQYSLILMDVQMPEMDGISAIKHIRHIEEERGLIRTPAIAMTAHVFAEDRSKCFDAGFDDFISKPMVEEDLRTKILLHLSGRPAGGQEAA